MNRLQKLQKIKELANKPPEIDYSNWTTDDLKFMYFIHRREEKGELKKTDPEFINAIKKMETKYNCKFDLRKI